MQPTCFVFVDTNILLEYSRLDHPAWRDAFAGRAPTFVISAVVLSELDKSKNSARMRVSRRAATALPWLRDQLKGGGELGNGVRIELYRSSPVRTLGAGELDARLGDDLLLATVIEFRDRGSQHVALLTEDVGLAIRAEGFALEAVSPPTELRLQEQLSDEEAELRALREAQARTKAAAPELLLSAGPNPTRISISRFDEPEDAWVARTVAIERRKWRDAEILGGEFREEVDQYLQRYEGYQREVFALERLQARGFLLLLELENGGGAPADDIDLFLSAPENVRFATGRLRFPQTPEAPVRPHPLGLALPVSHSPFEGIRGLLNMPVSARMPANVGDWHLDQSNVAQIHIKSVKHGLRVNLPLLHVGLFEVGNFGVEWSAHVRNSRDPFTNRMHFIVDEERSASQLSAYLAAFDQL